jgi:hypothetical protein
VAGADALAGGAAFAAGGALINCSYHWRLHKYRNRFCDDFYNLAVIFAGTV